MFLKLHSWLHVALRSVFSLALPLLCAAAFAQNADFAGKWVLALDSGRNTDYVLSDPANYERPVYRHAYRERSPESGLAWYACDPHAFYRSLDLEGRLDEYWQSRSRF